MLIEKTVSEFLDALSSPDPTPGGGSASAMAGALGAALLAMVAGMTKTKTGADDERNALDSARVDLLALQGSLKELVELDSAAYSLVVAAYKQPRDTDEEQRARQKTIQEAMRVATQVPLETMRACANVIRLARVVAAGGNPSASSDVKVGVQLALAGFRGAGYNVEINFGSLTDPEIAGPLKASMQKLMLEIGEDLGAVVAPEETIQ
jgi:formiminotetrahydrofolate cyclodeaminase